MKVATVVTGLAVTIVPKVDVIRVVLVSSSTDVRASLEFEGIPGRVEDHNTNELSVAVPMLVRVGSPIAVRLSRGVAPDTLGAPELRGEGCESCEGCEDTAGRGPMVSLGEELGTDAARAILEPVGRVESTVFVF